MTKSIGQLASEIFALLEKQTQEDNVKILISVSTLLDIKAPNILNVGSGNAGSQSGTATNNNGQNNSGQITSNAKAFFDQKLPQNKGEEFAVAAYFRQANGLGDIQTKDALKDVIKMQAKRTTFDEKNFARDMDNAKKQAKFFIKGEGKGEFILSATGEAYVEALPDRVAAAATKKAGKAPKAKKKKSKSQSKK